MVHYLSPFVFIWEKINRDGIVRKKLVRILILMNGKEKKKSSIIINGK